MVCDEHGFSLWGIIAHAIGKIAFSLLMQLLCLLLMQLFPNCTQNHMTMPILSPCLIIGILTCVSVNVYGYVYINCVDTSTQQFSNCR